MKNEVYLITCCKEKNSGGNLISSHLNLSFNETLVECRKKLISIYENIHGPLNWNQCMPAIDRYEGRTLYSSEVKNVIKNNSSKVLILSALFGILKPNDLIPNYNLKMNDIINGSFLYNFWREKCEECEKCILNTVLIQNNLNQNIKYINLLSKNYQYAFCGFTNDSIPSLNYIPNLVDAPNKEEVDFKNKMGHWKRNYLIKRLK